MNQDRKLIPFRAQPEDFKVFKDEGCYYIDKTGFIRYLIEKGDKICVFTRPRRFGKTLMLRTLQTFFEYVLDENGKPVDNRRYFEGLEVMDAGEDVLKHLGQYPVISLSFKDVSGDNIGAVIAQLQDAVFRACVPHRLWFKSSTVLSEGERQILQTYQDGTASGDHLRQFLSKYCQWLKDVTKRQTVILLDEYDVPLQKAAIYDLHHPGSHLYEETVSLIGSFISAGFKSNSNLAYGVISGCMRVAKESIFTGMNNPGVIDVVTDGLPDEFWGFTENDVKQMLAYYELEDKYQDIEQWYDGYLFGGRKVFNPWSLLNAIRGLVNHSDMAIQPYWVMTSGNDIIDDMIDRNPEHRERLALLMNGETRNVNIYKNISYKDLHCNPETIWSFLLYTGYLKAMRLYLNTDDISEAEVAIPNREIRSVMFSAMRHWWQDIKLRNYNADTLLHALLMGDTTIAERELKLILNDSTSVFDYNEAFYHGMLVGLLRNVAIVRSNDEYGEGRPDVVALAEECGMILEVKCVTPKALAQARKSQPDMDEDDLVDALVALKLDEAQQQIVDRKYVRAVLRHEPLARTVKAYAVCFCRKWCMVRDVK
ncbi:MAG: AAA family ATPase [Proteobacteria bacterium]|nr:AAA family ATPase [Pseudomonadota bacterium]